jgi:hypothetical protein
MQAVCQVRRAPPSLSKMELTPGSQRQPWQQQLQGPRHPQQAGIELRPVATNAGASGVQVSRLHWAVSIQPPRWECSAVGGPAAALLSA